MSEPKLDIIFTCHNHLELTIKSLKCLYDYTKPEVFKLTIVDDSIDETVPYLRRFVKEHDNVQVLRPKVKITGTNHAINLGLEVTNNPIVCFMGNSTFVEPDWLTSAYRVILEEEEYGLVGFKILKYPSGKIESTFIQGIQSDGRMSVPGMGEDGHRATFISEVFAIGGALYLIKREAIATLKGGKYDTESYIGFRGWDDLDLCLSIRKAGWKVMYNGYGVAFHQGLVTKADGIADEKFIREFEHNRDVFLSKWGHKFT